MIKNANEIRIGNKVRFEKAKDVRHFTHKTDEYYFKVSATGTFFGNFDTILLLSEEYDSFVVKTDEKIEVLEV